MGFISAIQNKHRYFTFEIALSNPVSDYTNATFFIPLQNLFNTVTVMPTYRLRSKETSRVTQYETESIFEPELLTPNPGLFPPGHSYCFLIKNTHNSLCTLDLCTHNFGFPGGLVDK